MQSIINAVLSSIRTNSKTIEQLTPVTALDGSEIIEINGGKHVNVESLAEYISAINPDSDSIGREAAFFDGTTAAATILPGSAAKDGGKVIFVQAMGVFGYSPDGISGGDSGAASPSGLELYANWPGRDSVCGPDGKPLPGVIYLDRSHQNRPYVLAGGNFMSFHAVYSAATQAAAGLMSAADKQKLDSLPRDARDVCYCMDMTGGEPPTAGAEAGTRVVVRGVKGDTVWVCGPDGVWVSDVWSCPGGRLRTDLIYAVDRGAGVPPELYVALVKPDGNCVLHVLPTRHWLETNGYISYVEDSDEIARVETGEPGTLKLQLTERIKETLGTNVEAIDPTGDPEAVDPDDLTATALRKTEQALTADERAQVLANLGDPQWALFDTMWLAAGDVNGEQVTTVDHSRAKPYGCLGVELTAAEAVEAYAYYRPTEPQELTRGYGNARARVLLPVRLGDDQAVTPMMFFGAAQLEALCITRANGAVPTLTYWSQLFDGCQKLRRIEGVLAMGSRCTTANLAFRNCYALEEVRITGLCVSIDFGRSSKLSVYSVAYMVDNAANTDAITITLHADVFAQLPPPLITLATAKNITLASA